MPLSELKRYWTRQGMIVTRGTALGQGMTLLGIGGGSICESDFKREAFQNENTLL